jgi:hypothetical protein
VQQKLTQQALSACAAGMSFSIQSNWQQPVKLGIKSRKLCRRTPTCSAQGVLQTSAQLGQAGLNKLVHAHTPQFGCSAKYCSGICANTSITCFVCPAGSHCENGTDSSSEHVAPCSRQQQFSRPRLSWKALRHSTAHSSRGAVSRSTA